MTVHPSKAAAKKSTVFVGNLVQLSILDQRNRDLEGSTMVETRRDLGNRLFPMARRPSSAYDGAGSD